MNYDTSKYVTQHMNDFWALKFAKELKKKTAIIFHLFVLQTWNLSSKITLYFPLWWTHTDCQTTTSSDWFHCISTERIKPQNREKQHLEKKKTLQKN